MPQSDPIVPNPAGQNPNEVARDRHLSGASDSDSIDPDSSDAVSNDPVASGPGTISPQGVVQGPDRWNRGAWLFRDSTLQSIETLLDEAFRVPGTNFRFGIDGIIGLVPGFGDVLAGLLSLIIPVAAWIRGVPYVTLVRMAANLGISVLIGSIPLFGDLFGIVVWKPNRRNYALLTRHLNEPRRHTGRDWAFLGILAAALGLIFAIPIVLIVWLVVWLSSQ
jgi:hypothetical protein